MPELARRSVTFDNGSEFALHENLNAELATQTYVCDPHSPWQRATIENTNGLLRRDMPRKTNLHDYAARDIDDLTWAINLTPRKSLMAGLLMATLAYSWFLANTGAAPDLYEFSVKLVFPTPLRQ